MMDREVPNGMYASVLQQVQQLIAGELREHRLTGISMALVDDQTVIYAGGFGMADEARRVPAGADTVYRCGSVSKLFNALAVMQLVEQGRLDLDAPITEYDEDFSIVVPFEDAGPITLRQLLCHRSGLIRESPVGSYFDTTDPGVEATVRSIAPCVLVNPPNTKTCYSNVGPTVAGHIVSKISGLPYEEYQQRYILGPMGMNSSAFQLNRKIETALARGYMAVAQPGGGFRRQEAPLFELGTLPAGNLYASAPDLARLAMLVFADGRAGEKQIIRPETLQEMLRVQLISEPIGFGIGFNIAKLGQRIAVGHNGAVYGFSSYLAAVPDGKVAAVVLANEDLVMGPVRMIAETALELMIEAKLGEKPVPPPAVTLAPEQLARLAGEYESTSFWASLSVADGRLQAVISGQPLILTPNEPLKFVAEGRWQWRSEFLFSEDSDGKVNEFQALTQQFHRINPAATPPPPAEWHRYVGSYGRPFIPLVVSIRNGRLHAFTENLADYRLTPINQTVFRMPPGLYTDEQIVFHIAPDGEVYSAILANVEMRRLR